MKNRIADNLNSEIKEVNEISFSKTHKFDFIKSQTLGGVKNLKQTNEHAKNEILARHKNFTAMNNYGTSESLTQDSSRNKHLSTIQTTQDLDKFLDLKLSK